VADTVADDTDTSALRPLQQCLIVYLIALALGAGRKVPKGQVELKLKNPWRDGTTHHVMSPLEFMQRLAALVPRPRLHLVRFHGVLAPNAKWRSKVVPQASDESKSLTATAAATAAPRASAWTDGGLRHSV
jgi:hypothetical protein